MPTLPVLSRVPPVRPLAAYLGGKRLLAQRIAARIADVPHVTYAEVFVGMGGVFFRRDVKPASEVINDFSEDVSTFFRVIQHHYVVFLDMIRFQISSQAGFEKLLAIEPSSLTDLQRSARFLYLQRMAFGGMVATRRFGVSPANPGRFDVTKIGPMIEAVHERLSGVVITRMDWSAFIARFDREATLFYLDPPYYGNEGDYGRDMFSRDQFAAMAEQLRGIKGKFILSINDHPEVRRIFAGFEMEEVRTRYTVGGNSTDKAKSVGELIITAAR